MIINNIAIFTKSEISTKISSCLDQYKRGSILLFIEYINRKILNQKIRFPLLEFVGKEIYQGTKKKDHITICDAIISLKTIGGNVIVAIILQYGMANNRSKSFLKATEYIAYGEQWYVSDIIGERIFGYSLLHYPQETLGYFNKIKYHDSLWVVRSIGPGIHYALKKGLSKQMAEKTFVLLLSLVNTKEYHIKKGIGWAAKTTAKFHPDIIEKYTKELENAETVKQWFKTKIKIGLQRNNYAQRN